MTSSSNPRNGIIAGGNWIIDQVKIIDVYPKAEQLANISSQSEGTGGSPYNLILDLAKLGAKFPLEAAGMVGLDSLGDFIQKDLQSHGVKTDLLEVSPTEPTSYTDVMTEKQGGRRTFFHMRGANAQWDGSRLDFTQTQARIFHLGYLLLLDAMDADDPEFGTVAARVLARAQECGLKTSIDLVSEDSDRFQKVVTPALKHVDYCVINEIEAGKTVGIPVRSEDGQLLDNALGPIAKALFEKGVKDWVVIHFPEGAYAQNAAGEGFYQNSLKLPDGYIKGSAGAGDAFCSGVMMGLHEGWPIQKAMETGVCAAAASLSDPTCTGGVGTLEEALALKEQFGLNQRF